MLSAPWRRMVRGWQAGEDWRGLVTRDNLTLARLIDTRQLAAGEYELAVRIRDAVSSQR